MNCKYCNQTCIKKGWYKTKQRYQCKCCNKYQLFVYKYEREKIDTSQIVLFTIEGMSISSIARIMKVSKTTVQRRLLVAANKLQKPNTQETAQEYEVDELCTFIGNKRDYNYTYITYAINRHTRQIVDFAIGSRSKEMISKVINKLLSLSPAKIYTDKLNIYSTIIPKFLHCNTTRKTNHIERKNLTLRNHLKRLSRKTLCYSKSINMLNACFGLYSFGINCNKQKISI